MTCKKCKGKMKEGVALQNHVLFSMWDFGGSRNLAGQTFTFAGQAYLVACWKCDDCGWSRRKENG